MAKRYYSKKHKEEKIKKRKIYLILYSILFIGILFSIGYFTRYDRFEITGIEIQGEGDKYIDDINRIVDDNLSDSMFLWLVSRSTPLTYSKANIKEDILNEIPKIKSISIDSRDRILDIQIEERGAEFVWCNNSCYLVDEDGLVYEETIYTELDNHLIYIKDGINNLDIGKRVVDDAELDNLRKIHNRLSTMSYEVESISIIESNQYEVLVNMDVVLRVTSLKNIDEQLDNMNTAFNDKGGRVDISSYEYIDLRFDNRVYTKDKEDDGVDMEDDGVE